MKGKLALGTAQFGLDYGINNESGKISNEEVFQILEFAVANGLDTLDTASAYGQSEEIIGQFVGKNSAGFKIISKISCSENREAKEELAKSLGNLGMERIYACLVHKFSDFEQNQMLWQDLNNFKKGNIIKKIGFSIYKIEELEAILSSKVAFDILQVPYSIFDRRFERYFSLLRVAGVEICVRSVFLQGLAFKHPDDLSGSLTKIRGQLTKLRNLSAQFNLSITAICLNFALLNLNINKVIIGVDNFEHLRKCLDELEHMEKVKKICGDLAQLSIEDENIILPFNWRLKENFSSKKERRLVRDA